MKKFLAIAGLMALLVSPALAQNQTVENTGSYLGINIEKTPSQQEGKQMVKNEKSFLFINIVVNGKIPFDKSEANN